MKLVSRVKYLIAAYKLIGDPNQLDVVFELVDKTYEPKFLQKMVDYMIHDPNVKRALELHPRLGVPNLEELEKLPEGTLGSEYAKYMRENKFNPLDLPQREVHDTYTFVLAHLYETHDIWHVITDFKTDVAGELGLQAFYFGQMPSRVANLLISLGLVNTLIKNFDEYESRMNSILRGWQMGRNAQFIFGQDWKTMWDKKLTLIRKDFGIDVKSFDTKGEGRGRVIQGTQPVQISL